METTTDCKRGGKRAGAGRPPSPGAEERRGEQVQVRLSGAEVEALDALRREGESRADVLRRLLRT